MDETYTSIALLEYMGEEYPDPYAADEAARQASEQLGDLSQVPGVQLWEPTRSTMALSQGYQRPNGTIPYKNQVVLTVFQLTPQMGKESYVLQLEDLPQEYLIRDGDRCTVKIKDGLWEDIAYDAFPARLPAKVRVVEDGTITLVDETQNITLDLSWLKEQEKCFDYVRATGIDVSTGQTITDEYLMGYRQVVVGTTGIIGKALYSYEGKSGVLIEVDPGDSGFSPQPGKRYLIHGQLYDSGNSGRAVVVTDFYEGCEQSPWVEYDSYDDSIFAQSIFTEYAQKYELGNNYIQVEASDQIAALEPFQQGTLYLREGRYPQAGEREVCVITFQWMVVGISNQAEGYEGRVWVSQGEPLPQTPLFGYMLGRAVLDNQNAVEAVKQMETQISDGVRVTLYDQGYAAAAQPLQAMEATAQGITLASLVGVLAVLCLFAFLFVGRQQQAVDVMVSLGTPKGGIRLWLLSGAILVAGIAILAGMAISAGSMQLLVGLALQTAQALYAADRRYSDGALGVSKDMEPSQSIPLWPALAAGVVVFVVALLLCVAFLRQARQKNTLRQGKSRVRVPRSGTSTAGAGALRFAWLSARRGGWRSVVVPVTSMVLTAFLGTLMVTALGWDGQKVQLYENTAITGQFTSVNGRQYTDLRLYDPWKLCDSGLIEEIQVYTSVPYWLQEESPTFADTALGGQLQDAWISKQPDMVFLNGLDVAPEFIYGEEKNITWLEGWDESFLADPSYYKEGRMSAWPCVASGDWMKKYALKLGDEVVVRADTMGDATVHIVGSYVTKTKSESMFLPLSFRCLPPWEAENDEQTIPYNGSFYGCCFTLKSAYDLENFREFLAQERYTMPGVLDGTRLVVLLDDGVFTQTVEALGRYMTLSQILFPVLFVLMGVLGFVVSWLMVNGRRMEFAIMRGLGAPQKWVFGSFFLEQSILCLAGCMVSGVALNLWSGTPLVWLAALGFGLCYLTGCALAVRAVGRTKIFTLLTHAD
ncbi:FtsX-like permease family protein [Pseudoflavonifractor sp. An85]|uniref:FtsX-like permease family protein n=1 Tax=Pseudoflavonifractor sp. An85 TaxID=1965661 RepID=UPI000B36EB88|nr:FtsX-like permease family protein [Pseudoflavonifractor sp. An85]OUN25246.1 hypothetical protein B5G37_04830 [Pseudoflavonifractor sp. An85]